MAPAAAEADAEVLVVGGGVVGAAAARALARGGDGRLARDVLLVEARRPGHRRGGSHGDGRIVRLTYPEPTYQAMARTTFAAWRALEDEVDQRLLVPTGSWECGPARSPQIAELAASLDAAEIPYRRFSHSESRRRFPQIELPLGSEVIYQPDGAVIHADRAVDALRSSAEAAGATLLRGTTIERVTIESPVHAPGGGGAPPVVATATGPHGESMTLRAHRLVLAAGAWTSQLLAPLGVVLPLRVTREVVAYFPVSARTAAWSEDHRAGTMPTVIDYHEERPFYALPQLEVPGVKVGWHRSGPTTDPRVDAVPDPAVLQRLVAYVGDRFPYLDLQPIRVTTCLYANTPDYHFVLDRHPRWPHVVIGAGFSGHGFKFAPEIGEILADLATDRVPSIDLDLFRLDRLQHPELVPRRSA